MSKRDEVISSAMLDVGGALQKMYDRFTEDAITLKEIAYELLEKYKASEECVIYWNGGEKDEKELAEEVSRYKKMIDDLT